MKTILAAIDGSPAAGPVLVTARAVARLFGGEVQAVHVLEDGNAEARAAAEMAGVELRTLSGDPLRTILALAQDERVAALVLGARSFPLGKRPAGHIALSVITSVNKPTVLVPPHARPAARFERILVALDGSRESSAALASVVARARVQGIEVVVLHVRDGTRVPRFSDQPYLETEAWSAEFIARHCGAPARDVSLELRVGFPAEEIARVAEEQDCQLLALCWSRSLAVDRAPVVRRAISQSSVPSLLVPV